MPRPPASGKFRIAIVVSGLGLSAKATEAASPACPPAVTLGFAPYAERRAAIGSPRRARTAMKCCWKFRWSRSTFPTAIPVPTRCAPASDEDANVQRLTWAMSRFTGYAGVTNLLGQRFLSDTDALSPTMTNLARRGLYFFDNGAAPQSVAPDVAGRSGAAFAQATEHAGQYPDRAGDRPASFGAGRPGARPWQRRRFGFPLSGHRGAHRRLGQGT